MIPVFAPNNVSDQYLTHSEQIGNPLLRPKAIGIKFAYLDNLGVPKFGRSVFHAPIDAIWSWATPESFGMYARSVSITARPSAFTRAIRRVFLVRSWKQVAAITARAVITRVTCHEWAGVFPGGQKQRNAVRVESHPTDVEPTVATWLKASRRPRPASIWSTGFIDVGPKASNLSLRKIRNWPSLIISHAASIKADWSEPLRMFAHPFGSFNFNMSEVVLQ